MDTRTADALHRRYSGLRSDRSRWDSLFRELSRYYLPDRACLYSGEAETGRPNAESDRTLIFDSTGEDAVAILAASLQGLLMNPALAWFDMRLQDYRMATQNEVKDWLDDARKSMLAVINAEGTGFNTQSYELCLDVGAVGTACMYVEEDDDSIVRFYCIPISNIYFSENAKGVADTVYHRIRMTARQIDERWPDHGIRSVSDKVENDPEAQFTVIHCVHPRATAMPTTRVATKDQKPFASYYYEEGTKEILEEGGYDEMPYLIVRWSKASGDVMGRGPSHAALPDVRMLNQMSKTQMMAAEKMADPPLMVPDDGFLGGVHTGPGGLTYYRANTQDRIEPLPVEVDLASTEAMLEQRRASVRRIMLADQLQSPESPTMTATQFLQLVEERYRVLGPTLGRFQAEFLSPLVNRVFQIMLRAGEFEDVPEALAGERVVVEYVNPVSRNQRAAEARAMSQAIEFLAPLIGQEDPFGMLDNFDFDEIARDTQSLFGYPAKYLREKQEVDATRKAKQEQAQAMSAMQTAASAAEVAKTAADADMSGQNALTALTGGMA